MPWIRSLGAAAVGFVALLSPPGLGAGLGAFQAGSPWLDFEWFPGPDGRLGTADDVPAPECPGGFCFPLSDEFASVGLQFTSGTLYQGDLFPSAPPTNHYVTSGPLDVDLAGDGRAVAIDSYSAWNAVLWLLDADDQVVATTTLVNPSPGNLYLGTLALTATEPFRRVTVRPEGCGPSDVCAQILNVDDFEVRFVEIFGDGFESGDTSGWEGH